MTELDEKRWSMMPMAEQMANIGSEIGRSLKWLSKGKPQMAEGAFLRCLDLIDLTIKYGRKGEDGRNSLLRELCRAREYYVDAYMSANSDKLIYMDCYFAQFASICRPQR